MSRDEAAVILELAGIRPRGEDDDGGPAEAPSLLSRILPGGCILDVPAVPEAVWGHSEEILWAAGQSLILAGPDGVGKTTIAGNIVQARLGLGPGSVLGLPVAPGRRNVLVLLMDRPQQAMASLARFFTGADRETLDARLRVWRGPPPQDLARNTGMLAELCLLADADTCVIDSLKDAALKLSDDETGSGWNRARQIAIEAGTQLLELHHPRKSQEGNRKPSKLEDLYGSRWIPAGAGSVLSLWGEAGDPVVELTHLKPIVTTLGPWHVTLDGKTGRVAAEHDTDLVEQTRLRGAAGMTVAAAAQLLSGAGKPSRSDIEKARRRRPQAHRRRPPARAGRGNRARLSLRMAPRRTARVRKSRGKSRAPPGHGSHAAPHGRARQRRNPRSGSHAGSHTGSRACQCRKVTPGGGYLYTPWRDRACRGRRRRYPVTGGRDVRSMKARRPGKCRCGRPILIGDRITRHDGQWLCTPCAISVATAKRQAAA